MSYMYRQNCLIWKQGVSVLRWERGMDGSKDGEKGGGEEVVE